MTIVGESIARRAHAFQLRAGSDRGAWIVWACFALMTVIVRLDSVPSLENVWAIYRDAGLRWLDGQDLYPAQFHFNYFPPSAVLFAAWSPLPFTLGGALWRVANIAVFAYGVWRLSCGTDRSRSPTRFLIASIVAVILSDSAARHGQMTLAMAGFMMVAVADAERGALWRAAVYAALAVAFKPLAAVLVLLLFAIYPRVGWRMAIALAALFLLPFVFQHPDYVWRQWAAVPAMLVTRAGKPYEWQHVFTLLDMLGWTATSAQEAVIRGVCAVFVLFLCWRARQRAPVIGVALTIYALATCYILLFGSGTERNTYAMMTPVVGLLAATAWEADDRAVLALMSAVMAIMLLSNALQHAFPHTVLAMVKPVACLVVSALLVWIVLRTPRETNTPAAPKAGPS